MKPVLQTTKHELVAACLREGMREGRWQRSLPGVVRLAVELDVSPHTVRRALLQLEAEGVLGGRELGRSRAIVAASAVGVLRPPLRVGILRYDVRLTDDPTSSQVLLEIQKSLEAAGHAVFLSNKSQLGLRHDVRRIASYMAHTAPDAWVIESGSHELLEWCVAQPVPCLALYGHTGGLALARTGPDKVPAYLAATRHLLAFGHRRIVLIVRESRRKPTPGSCEQAFLDELSGHGIVTGDYHLPNWEETPSGLSKLLENYFTHSPPTALIVNETACYIAAAEFLARRGIQVPRQVSLVSSFDTAALAWCHPSVAHMRWDNTPIVRRVVHWVGAVKKGNADRKTINFPVEFVPGGSIGPVCVDRV